MRPTTRFAALAALVLLSAPHAAAQTWTQTAAGTYNWNDNANWSGVFPNSGTAIADVTTVLTGNVAVTIALGQDITVNQLAIGSAGGTYTVQGANTFTLGGTAPEILMAAGAQTVSLTPTVIALGADAAVTNASTASTLTIGVLGTSTIANGTSGLTFRGAGNTVVNSTFTGTTGTITKAGSGTVTFAAPNIASGFGAVAVNGGTLRVNTLALTQARTVAIDPGAVFESNGTLQLNVNGTSTYTAVSGTGTLRLTGTGNSITTPDIDFGPNHSGNSFWGVRVDANIDLGGQQRFVTARTGNNSFGMYFNDADAVLNGNISGAGGLTLRGLNTFTAGTEVPFVFGGANTFAGPLEIQRGSVYLNNANALRQGAPAFFNTQAGGQAARLYLWGNDASIGSLDSAGPGTVGIANGIKASGSNPVALGPVTLTINQTTNGTFAGPIAQFIDERGSGTGAVGELSLVKNGPASLNLAAIGTYTGTTTVNAGTLRVRALSQSRGYTVAGGATLNVTDLGATTTLTTADMTFGTGASTLGLNTSEARPTTTPIVGVTNLAANGTTTLNVSGTFSLGQYVLIDYAGTIGGNGFAGFALGTLPPRAIAALVNNAANTSVDLNITGIDTIRWTGSVNALWNIDAAQNWRTVVGNQPTTYLQPSAPGDAVTFNDLAAGNFTVNVAETVSPTAVIVDNTANNYTFTGTGAIAGTAGLTKTGTGTLTIANANTFTGTINVNAGTLRIGNGGTTGSLAAPVVNNAALVLDRSDDAAFNGGLSGAGTVTKVGTNTFTLGGALSYTGTTTISAGTLSLNPSNAFTYNGTIAGPGVLGMAGASTVTLGGTNTYTGGTAITGGTLAFTTGTALGTGAVTVATTAANQAGFAGSPGTPFLNNATDADTTLANAIVLPAPAAATTYTLLKTSAGGQLNLTGNVSGGNANTKLFLNFSAGGDNTSTYRLAGNNTFVATLELWRGGLIVASPTALGDPGNLIRMDSNNNTTLGDLRFEVGGTFANPIEFVAGADGPISTNANAVTLTGLLSGGSTSGLRKLGTGTLTVTAANTYTGVTTVSAGALFVNGNQSAAAGAVGVSAGATLGGTGTVGGAVVVDAGGAVRGGTPGDTGTLTVANNVTVNSATGSAGVLRVEASRTGANAAAASRIALTGAGGVLNLNPGAGNTFTIDLVNGATGLAMGETYTVTLATVATAGNIQLNGSPLTAGTVIDPSNYVLRSSAFAAFNNVSLVVNGSGTGLVLTFTPVPEPATVLAVAAGALALAGLARRRPREAVPNV